MNDDRQHSSLYSIDELLHQTAEARSRLIEKAAMLKQSTRPPVAPGAKCRPADMDSPITRGRSKHAPDAAAVSSPIKRGKSKLAPDAAVRCAIVAAASESAHDQGVRGLSIAAVMERTQLGTRAFYRHFKSKDQLVAAVLSEMSRVETLRLRTKMANTTNPVEAVAAWIDGRLDLAFDEKVSPAGSAIIEPLIEQLQRGLELGVFKDIVPVTEAKSIHGVLWAATRPQWATRHWDRDEVRQRLLRFCLRGLGVASETFEQITASDAQAG
jgi:AcrR family transcriptional regulator